MRAHVSLFLLVARAACDQPTFTSLSGTSTRGMENKKSGPLTAPIIGVCSYADNDTCRAAAAGWGEYFRRSSIAHDITMRNRYSNRPLLQAANGVAIKKPLCHGGDGSIITLGRHGNISMTFNT